MLKTRLYLLIRILPLGKPCAVGQLICLGLLLVVGDGLCLRRADVRVGGAADRSAHRADDTADSGADSRESPIRYHDYALYRGHQFGAFANLVSGFRDSDQRTDTVGDQA
jgi:hypothetical protein